MSDPQTPDRADESELSIEEYGSLTVEDDPDGTADDADHDLPDRGTRSGAES